MWILIETFWGAENAAVITDEDGNNEVFDTKDEAEAYAEENLHAGVAVEV